MGLMNAARHRLGTGDIIWRCCAKVAELPTKFSHRNSRRSLYNRHKDKLVSLRRVNSASRSLHVLRDVVAERPVFRQHFDQVDEDPFRAQAGVGGQFFDDAPKQLLLLRARAGVADGELNDDEVIAALDAEIVCVVGEIIFVVPRVRCSTPLMPVNSMRRIALRNDAKRRDGEVLFEEQFRWMGAPDFNRRPRLRRPPDVLIRLLPLAR